MTALKISHKLFNNMLDLQFVVKACLDQCLTGMLSKYINASSLKNLIDSIATSKSNRVVTLAAFQNKSLNCVPENYSLKFAQMCLAQNLISALGTTV